MEPVATGDGKYIVFKTEVFTQWLDHLATMNIAEMETPWVLEDALKVSLPDAVVIRRQDLFASPALATYANCIALSARLNSINGDERMSKRLMRVSDYFESQAQLAAEEGFKYPGD